MAETKIQYQFFPRSMGLIQPMEDVINAFLQVESDIATPSHNLKSDEVLSKVRPYLEMQDFLLNRINLKRVR